MKLKRFLTGFLAAALVVSGVPLTAYGSAEMISRVPDVTVTAPAAGKTQANAVLTSGFVSDAEFTTQGLTISDDGAISGKMTATGSNADTMFNVTGTTKLLIHFQMKSGKVDNIESIIGKMNSQYGVQIASKDSGGEVLENPSLIFYARLEDNDGAEQWAQVVYRIPNDAWYTTWHDVVAYYDGNALNMYVDGNAAEDDREITGALREDTDSVFTIGYNKNPLPNSTADPEGNKQQYFGQLKDAVSYTHLTLPTTPYV